MKKASKAHAGQAKTLQSVMSNGKKRKNILELARAKNQKVVAGDSILMRIRVILCLSSLLLLLTLGERWQRFKKINKPFARKIQILTVVEQRAKVAGKPQQAAIAKRGKEAIRKKHGKKKR